MFNNWQITTLVMKPLLSEEHQTAIKECKGDVKSIKNLSTGKSVSEINHTY